MITQNIFTNAMMSCKFRCI